MDLDKFASDPFEALWRPLYKTIKNWGPLIIIVIMITILLKLIAMVVDMWKKIQDAPDKESSKEEKKKD